MPSLSHARATAHERMCGVAVPPLRRAAAERVNLSLKTYRTNLTDPA